MKKKNLVIVMLVAVLAFTLGMGTLAYYKKTLASSNNTVRAAKFTVNSDGTLEGNRKFDLTDDPVYPGIKKDIYEFRIDKTDTEVPVKYEIKLTPYGGLFRDRGEKKLCPVDLVLYREVGGEWSKVGNTDKVEINPVENDIEKFKIELVWNHSDYDIEYQNKTGKVAINVVATQVDESESEEPEIKATFHENDLLKNFGFVTVDVQNVEGAAKFDVTYKLADGKDVTTEIANIGEEAGMIFYTGENNVVIRIYDEQGNLLHTFKNVKLQ